jgi:hypothetical protein
MAWWFYSFWWLIFPIMGFMFGAFGMWMNYRRHRDTMELMKTYAAQGKDPAEIAKILGAVNVQPPPYWGGYSGGYGGAYGAYGGGYWGRYGPLREWRRVIIFSCLAVGFGLASRFADIPGAERAFTLVAIIMAVLGVGSLALAILSSVFAASADKNVR